MLVPQNGWFIREILLKWMIQGYPHLWKPPNQPRDLCISKPHSNDQTSQSAENPGPKSTSGQPAGIFQTGPSSSSLRMAASSAMMRWQKLRQAVSRGSRSGEKKWDQVEKPLVMTDYPPCFFQNGSHHLFRLGPSIPNHGELLVITRWYQLRYLNLTGTDR